MSESMDVDTTNTLPGLELVEDDFTKEEHKALDGKLSGVQLTSKNFDDFAPIVLSIIVGQLGDRGNKEYRDIFNPKYMNLCNEPAIREKLIKGPQQGYRMLRRLKILRRPIRVKLDADSMTVRDAWNHKFHGNYHEIMLRNLNNMDRAADQTNCAALIQSSGCGKSRMVDEMAKLVFTIPINIRDPAEAQQGAWPPTDEEVWRYLCKLVPENVDEGWYRVRLFFWNLFYQVNEEVKKVFSGKEGLQPDELARKWRDHLTLDKNRNELYERVTKACQMALMNPRQLTKPSEPVSTLLQSLGNFSRYPDKFEGVKIMLYFDEAHELDKPITDGKLYDLVWPALNSFWNRAVFTIFLSTQSTIDLLEPSARTTLYCSQEYLKRNSAPITETPFDCHLSFPVHAGQYTLTEVGNSAFLARFGRPLFWTMFERGKENGEPLLVSAMDLARKKLIFDDDIKKTTKLDGMAISALLDVLISIDYEPKRKSAEEHQSEMIANHMRTAFSIPQHRCYVRSGYPSEPFLAEAASRQMYYYMKNAPDFSMTKILRESFESRLIDLGQKGEMVMRLLLRKAYMDAIVAEQGDKDPNFSQGCSLLGFLRALFPQEFHTSILNCRPANKDATPGTLADVFKNAVVRFTHFVQAADDYGMSSVGMLMAFIRASAIIGHNRQKVVDIAVPVLFHRDAEIAEGSMTALLIQVKRRHRVGNENAHLIDWEKIHFFPQVGSDTPYLTLIAELGVESTSDPVVIDTSGDRESDRIASKSSPEHPRYSILACGCTAKTWKAALPGDDDSYAQILSTDSLMADHPRQDEKSLQLVHQMLPFWHTDTAWFSGDVLEQHGVVEMDSDSEVGDSEMDE